MQVETPVQQGDKFASVFSLDESTDHLPAAPQASMSTLMLSGNGMERAFRFAEMMAKGVVAVPQHLRGNPADCLAVVIQALQWDMNPYTVAQKSHVSKSGQLAFDGQLIASVVATRAPVTGLPRYEHHGDWSKVRGKFEKKKGSNGGDYLAPTYTAKDEEGLFVRVSVLLKNEAEPRVLDVYMEQCQPRFSTQWASDPEQQICYAAIRKWARRHTPNVILGVYSDDEMDPEPARHMGNAQFASAPTSQEAAAHPKLASAEAAARKGVDAYAEFWKAITLQERQQLAPGHEARKQIATAADKARTVDNGAAGAAAQAGAAATEAGGAPAVTYDALKKRLNDALADRNLDALNEAANLIGAVVDAEQQTELEALYEAHLGALS